MDLISRAGHNRKKFSFTYGCFLVLVISAAIPAQLSAARDTRDQWDKKWGPLVPHKTFPRKCDLCHIPERWDVLRPDFHFDHLKETGYPLEGAHATAACLRCHNDRGPVSAYVARGCSGCHVDPHRSALGLRCQKCHNEVSWTVMTTAVSQHAQTRFPLVGVHATVECQQCHPRSQAGDFTGAATDCYSCHRTDYLSTQNPNHTSLNFPTTCASCHNTTTWLNATFDHSFTGFPLTGLHMSPPRSCSDCHVNNNYGLTNTACISCHQTDYNGATSPINHITSQLTNCQDCHDPSATWNSTPKWTHPTGSCGGGTGTTTPWTHQNVQSCTDCHTLTAFPSGASGWNCSLCHSGHHAGTSPNTCP
jgi:LSD1 subclass zinc finger protein